MCCARSCLIVPRPKVTTTISKRFVILTTNSVTTNLTKAVLWPMQAYPASMMTGKKAEFSDEQNDVSDEVIFRH